MTLTTDELLLGGTTTHVVEIPFEVLRPAGAEEGEGDPELPPTFVLRPLLLADVQRVHHAAEESRGLTSVLMVQQALVEPSVTVDDVTRMHAGLVEFLLRQVNRISGLTLAGDELEEAVQAPLARATYVLAREFGWTTDECAALTVGQVLLYLELLGRGEGSWSLPAS
jgi:hypothetical protein